MSEVDVSQGRARVVVEADLFGTYPDDVIRDLRRAVLRCCRAIDTEAARDLVSDLTAEAS